MRGAAVSATRVLPLPVALAISVLASFVLVACTFQNLAVLSSEVLIMDVDGGMPACPLAAQPVCEDWSRANDSTAHLVGGYSNTGSDADEHFEARQTALKRAVQRYVSEQSGWNGVASSITLHCHRTQVVAGTNHRFVAVINVGCEGREKSGLIPSTVRGSARLTEASFARARHRVPRPHARNRACTRASFASSSRCRTRSRTHRCRAPSPRCPRMCTT